MPTIARYYFTVCTRGAERAGIDRNALLGAAGIDPAALERSGWRGDVRAMARLVRAIWRALDDEGMGYTGQSIPRGTFAFAVQLASEAETVGEGIRRALRLYNLVTRDIRTHVHAGGGTTAVTARFARSELDPDHYFCEFWMMIWHRLACWLAGETVPMLAATFDYSRPDAYYEEFRHLFPCRQRFDARGLKIILDSHALASPIRRDFREVRAMVAAAPLDLMVIPASDQSTAREVKALLARDRSRSGEQIARELGISSETLRRRLRNEGTSLSEERESSRRDAATRALTRSTASIEAIAGELGYAEARSFTRAFHAWTGLSPSEYRRSQGG